MVTGSQLLCCGLQVPRGFTTPWKKIHQARSRSIQHINAFPKKTKALVISCTADTPGESSMFPVKTAVGAQLEYLLYHEPHLFSPTVTQELERIKEKQDVTANEEGEGSSGDVLQSRIRALREQEQARDTLQDVLQLQVLDEFQRAARTLVPDLEACGPDGVVVETYVDTAALPQLLPAAALQEAMSHVLGMVSVGDADALVQVDRVQAAQLYRGSIQFGYFISAVLRGLELLQGSGPQQVPEFVLQRYSKQTETELAGALANHRTAALFDLYKDGNVDSLETFSSSVQIASTASASEFFDVSEKAGDNPEAPPPPPSDEIPETEVPENTYIPGMDLVPLTALSLQGLLCEAVVFGWFLWEKEKELQNLGHLTVRLNK